MAMNLLQMKQMFPDPVRQGVIDVMWREGPTLFERLNFIKVNGLAYPYSKESALPGVSFRSLNEEFSATVEGVVSPAVENLAILGGNVTTDSIVIAQKGLGPARAWRLARKAKAAARRFIKNFISGSRATDPKSFDGLKTRISAGQTITNATNGAVPSYKKFVQLLDKVEGDNTQKLLLMNQTTRRLLSEDVASNAGGMGVFDVGKQLTTFCGAPIQEIYNDETEAAILPFTEVCGSSGAACASGYCVRLGSDMDEEYVQGLAGLDGNIQVLDVGYTGASYTDVLQAVWGMGLFSGYCAARIEGLKAS